MHHIALQEAVKFDQLTSPSGHDSMYVAAFDEARNSWHTYFCIALF